MRAVEDGPISPFVKKLEREFAIWIGEQRGLPADVEDAPAGEGTEWTVIEMPGGAGYGVFRAGESEPVTVCEKESMAYFFAAVLIARSIPGEPVYRLVRERDASGYHPVVDVSGEVVGRLESTGEAAERVVNAMNLVEQVRRSPKAMFFFLHAASCRTIEEAGGYLAWSLEHPNEGN